MTRFTYALIILVAGTIIWMTSHNKTRGEESKAINSQGFGDGILVLSIDRTSGIEARRSSNTMVNAKLVKMGDRYFVQGEVWVGPNFPDLKYQNGVASAVAWEDVAGYYVFSEEQIVKYIAQREENE